MQRIDDTFEEYLLGRYLPQMWRFYDGRNFYGKSLSQMWSHNDRIFKRNGDTLIPSTTIVYLWGEDIFQNNLTTGAFFSVYGGPFKYQDTFIDYSQTSVQFNASGYAQIQIIESETPGSYYNFSIKYPIGTTYRQINFNPVIIPNIGAVNLCTIATVKGSS